MLTARPLKQGMLRRQPKRVLPSMACFFGSSLLKAEAETNFGIDLN